MLLSTDEICKVCFEFPGEKLIQTECGCSACFDCQQSWVRSQLEEGRSLELRCPMPECKYIFSDNQIRTLLSPENRELYERVQSLMYLRECPDVRMCPVYECKYAGFKSKGQYDFYCPRCDMCWEEKRTTLSSSLKNLRNSLNELTSVVWKGSFCKNCPGCQVPIEKNAGCPHMTCWTCGHQFCWKCMDNWLGHEPGKCETMISCEICVGVFLCLMIRLYFLSDPVYWIINSMIYYMGYLVFGVIYTLFFYGALMNVWTKLRGPFREYDKVLFGSFILFPAIYLTLNDYMRSYEYTTICLYIGQFLLTSVVAFGTCRWILSSIRWRV